jgi:hypothetical protein
VCYFSGWLIALLVGAEGQESGKGEENRRWVDDLGYRALR